MRLLRRTPCERTGLPRLWGRGPVSQGTVRSDRVVVLPPPFDEPLGRGLSGGHRVVRLLRHTDLLDRHWRRSCLDFDTRSKGNGGFFLSAYYGMPSFGFDAVVPLKGGKVIAEVPLTNLSLEIFGTF